MNRKTSRRLIRRLGLALAVVAFAAPAAAQGMPVISQEGGTAPVQQTFYPDDLHATVPHLAVPNLANDQIVYSVSSEPTDSLGRPLTPPEPTDSLGRPLGRPDVVQPPSDVVSASSGLDWTQVGIGLFAFGMLLLGGGALIISRQNRRSRLAAA